MPIVMLGLLCAVEIRGCVCGGCLFEGSEAEKT